MQWHLAILVISFLFGFAMQRGGFCGASIFSSVVLFKERQGVVGVGLAVLVAMAGFAGLAALGWLAPNPKAFSLLPAIVGGTVFGVGMVLAGGCVSGSLFKAGEGRVNSMLAVVGIGVGAYIFRKGFLAPARRALASVTGSLDLPAGIYQAAGISYVVLGAVVGVVGLAVVLILTLKKRTRQEKKPLLTRLVKGKWSFAAAGIFIGVLGWLAYLAYAHIGRNYPLGPTRGVVALFSLLQGPTTPKLLVGLEALAIIAGSLVSAWMRGGLKLRSADATTLVVSLLGGVLVGAGAVIGRGCFVGHVLSGVALLSFQSILFGLFMILANWATTILYLRGWRS